MCVCVCGGGGGGGGMWGATTDFVEKRRTDKPRYLSLVKKDELYDLTDK